MSTQRVGGKVIVITGAASGQGAAEAIRLAEEGATVIPTDLTAPDGEHGRRPRRRRSGCLERAARLARPHVRTGRRPHQQRRHDQPGAPGRGRPGRVEPHAGHQPDGPDAGDHHAAGADGHRRLDRQRRLDRRHDGPLHGRLHRQQMGPARAHPHRGDGARSAGHSRQRGSSRLHPHTDDGDRLGGLSGGQRDAHPAGPRRRARGGGRADGVPHVRRVTVHHRRGDPHRRRPDGRRDRQVPVRRRSPRASQP